MIDACYKAGRKIVLTGQDFGRIIRTAMKLGKLTVPDENLFIPQKEMKKYAPEELLILETGRMGEPIKSLQRMAKGTHRTFMRAIWFILRLRQLFRWRRWLLRQKILFIVQVARLKIFLII